MPEQLASGHDPDDSHGAGPVAAPAFALVSSDGSLVHASEPFLTYLGTGVLRHPAVLAAVSDITASKQGLAVLRLDTQDGESMDARAEAVLDADDRRFALIETMIRRPPPGIASAAAWLSRFVDASPAIVWLKDLEGRYVYVNAEYTRQLGATSVELYGRSDVDLDHVMAIDAPRSRGQSTADEPMQLEYTIPAFDRRPAFAALRFPLLEADGHPCAVCGIASPADRALVSRAECARLLDVARWYRGDAAELRRAALADWGVRALHPQGAIDLLIEDHTESDAAAAAVLSSEFAAITARAEAAEAAEAELAERVRELQREVAREHQRAADAEGSLTDARGRADALAAHLELTNAQLGGLEAAYARIRDLEAMVATVGAAGVAAAESARRVTELSAACDAAHARIRELEAALAATEVAPSPERSTEPATASPTPQVPEALSRGPAHPSGARSRIGWDPSAQAALSAGLRSCSNLRSVFTEAVRLVGDRGGWDAAVAWSINARDGTCACCATWVRSPVQMARLETSIWQVRQDPSTSRIGSTASTPDIIWVSNPAADGDPHLAALRREGMHTVVLLPIREGERTLAVLELCTATQVQESAADTMALRSIAAEISAAGRRVIEAERAAMWGQRGR